LERGNPKIDLGYFEADDLEIEIEPRQGKILELLRKQLVVPGRDFGQPVVGDHESSGLSGGQVIEAQGRHLAPAELAASRQPAVAGDNLATAVDQEWHVEAECLDA